MEPATIQYTFHQFTISIDQYAEGTKGPKYQFNFMSHQLENIQTLQDFIHILSWAAFKSMSCLSPGPEPRHSTGERCITMKAFIPNAALWTHRDGRLGRHKCFVFMFFFLLCHPTIWCVENILMATKLTDSCKFLMVSYE